MEVKGDGAEFETRKRCICRKCMEGTLTMRETAKGVYEVVCDNEECGFQRTIDVGL